MKAIDLKICPTIRIKDVSIWDEIRFNLFHNNIEMNKRNLRRKRNESCDNSWEIFGIVFVKIGCLSRTFRNIRS